MLSFFIDWVDFIYDEKIKWCKARKNGIELTEPNDNLAKEYIDNAEEKSESDTSFARLFITEPNTIYYLVTYGDNDKEGSGTYVFKDFNDAINMLGFFVDYKAQGLSMKMKFEIPKDEE